MIKYWFNHEVNEKEQIEHLAQNYGLMVSFGTSQYDMKTISVEKDGVVIVEDPLNLNVVVFKELATDQVYVIPVSRIMNIRVFR